MARPATKKKPSRRTRAASAAKRKAAAPKPQLTVPTASSAKPAGQKFPSSWRLLRRTAVFWRQHAQLLAVYLLVVLGLNLFLVHNFGADVSQLKDQVSQTLGGSAPVKSLATYALFVGSSSGNAQGSAAVFQYIVLTVVSLSTIWLLRQLLSDHPPARLRVRDAFYQGMYPLVPFVLVLLVLTLELIPLVLAGFIYTTVVQNGIAVGAVQDIAWLMVLLIGAFVTIWLLATHFLGLYIATLPNMSPVRALRSAKQLSRGQRPNLIRKALVLLLVMVLVSAVLLLPAITLAPVLAGSLLFVLGIVALPFAHSYFYMMYRELLSE